MSNAPRPDRFGHEFDTLGICRLCDAALGSREANGACDGSAAEPASIEDAL